MSIRDIQLKLSWLGYQPGPIDGVWGRRTSAALRHFQARRGLDADGIAGPMTLAALFPHGHKAAAPLDDPALVWFQEARRLMGVSEVPGGASNATILDWASDLGIPYSGDDIAWCGLFVGHCLSATLEREPIPGSLLAARAWQAFGVQTDPTPGAVMVFWRKSPASGLGHVGFYAGEDAGAYRILGGNQSDKVSLAWVGKDRLVSARWPATRPPPVPKPIMVSRSEGLSVNEA